MGDYAPLWPDGAVTISGPVKESETVMTAQPEPDSGCGFPFQPVALKILGDGVLVSTLLGLSGLSPDAAATALLLGLIFGVFASSAAGVMLIRSGHREYWDITTIASLGAMAVLLVLHGAILVAGLLSALAWFRWRRVEQAASTSVES